MHPPQTLYAQAAPRGSISRLVVVPLQTNNWRNPYPCSLRFLSRRSASAVNGFEMLQSLSPRSVQTEVMPRQFLSPFDAGGFGSIPVRCSLVLTRHSFRHFELLQLRRVS